MKRIILLRDTIEFKKGQIFELRDDHFYHPIPQESPVCSKDFLIGEFIMASGCEIVEI